MARNREPERRAAQLRQAAVFAWYGQECGCCGSTDSLGVDHVDGDGPAQRADALGHPGRVGYNPARLYLWLIENGFPEGFGVLCKPCNSSKGSGDACRLDHSKDQATRRRDATRARGAAWRARHGIQRQVSVRPGTAGGRILAYLAEQGPSYSGVIAAALTMRSASNDLGGLRRDGQVIQIAHRLYCLPGQEPTWVRPGVPGGYTTNQADARCCCPCATSHPGPAVCQEADARRTRRVSTAQWGTVCIRVCDPCEAAVGTYIWDGITST